MTPTLSAAITHGRTLASWSSLLTMISSPGSQSLAIAREMSKVSWVMLRPNTTPSGTPPTQVRHRRPCRQHDVVGVALGLRQPPAVGERLGDGVPHRLPDDVGGLGATRTVEVRRAAGEAGEVRAQRLDVVHVGDPARLPDGR